MKTYGPNCITWQDVLIENGIDPEVSRSLIGFVSWNKGEEPSMLGENITKALSDHRGAVYAMDVVSGKYNDKGLLFVSGEVSPIMANNMFDIIMNYEQQEVYKMNET